MTTPRYRLQIEFDFNSQMTPDKIEGMMLGYFQMLLNQWNEHAELMKDMGALRVEVVDN